MQTQYTVFSSIGLGGSRNIPTLCVTRRDPRKICVAPGGIDSSWKYKKVVLVVTDTRAKCTNQTNRIRCGTMPFLGETTAGRQVRNV